MRDLHHPHAWQTTLQALENTQILNARQSLAPVSAAHAALAIPDFSCPVITVTGTNGKGSVATFLATLFTLQGYRTGLFTSPHLNAFNERIQINLQPVTNEQIANAFDAFPAIISEHELGWFDTVTLIALKIFAESNLDIVILEVGIGGRLDPTNVINADLAIVTSIALDHCHLLGNTRAEIALEKAGIFRPQHPAVLGEHDVPSVLFKYAEKITTPLYCVGREFLYEENAHDWSWRSDLTHYAHLPKPSILLNNAATALMAAELMKSRLPWTEKTLHQALEQVRLPGRLQCIPGDVPVILDVAHNPAACQQLADYLKQQACVGKTIAVVAFYADKAYLDSVEALRGTVDQWLVASSVGPRGLQAQQLAAALSELSVANHVSCYDTVVKAFQCAQQVAVPGDRIVVFGSFSTVEAVLRL